MWRYLDSLFARTTTSDLDSAGEAVTGPRWGLATAASLGVGAYLIIHAIGAGAPIGESLLAGTIVSVALFLYYAIAQRESFPSAAAVRQRLRHPSRTRPAPAAVPFSVRRSP